MAQPLAFPEANDVDPAPHGMEGLVQPLPILRGRWSITSCWGFSAAEWAEVERTRRVWLATMGLDPRTFMVSGRRADVIAE